MKQARILTEAEFKRVLAVVNAGKHAERNRAVLYLSFYAGLRACEIASLRLHDVIDDERRVKSQFVLEKHMTKGNERQRVIVNSSLRKELQRYVDSVCLNYSVNDAFIKSQKGGSFTPLTIVQLFARIYKQAGIVGASSHSGRRQFITALADNQINVRVIQALARHRHLNTTMRYIDVNDRKLEKAVEVVGV
jgi:integrase/recombinase XerD|tara:strand:+ start:220 stop:795 length:576 start_codon:yes stop_codon:yes gene_type:complete